MLNQTEKERLDTVIYRLNMLRGSCSVSYADRDTRVDTIIDWTIEDLEKEQQQLIFKDSH